MGEVTTKLLPAVQGHRLSAAFLLFVMTGFRRGEMGGLRWQDVDWQGEVLHIRQTLVRVKNHDTGRTQLVFQDPKTEKSRRSIPLPEACLAALRQHRARQAEERLMLGPAYQDHDLVFCQANGTPLDPSTLDRAFSKALQRAGLPCYSTPRYQAHLCHLDAGAGHITQGGADDAGTQ
jgi:integrase